MNIRTGFDRLSKLLLGIAWALYLVILLSDGVPDMAHLGESFFYMLLFSAAYLLMCRAIAWVYNGFTSK